jgi:hypothetical protein
VSDRLGAVVGVLLLAGVLFLLALTLIELAERGAPWSESGYHAKHALGAGLHPGPNARPGRSRLARL